MIFGPPCSLPEAVAALFSEAAVAPLPLLQQLSNFCRGFPRFLCFGGSAGGRSGEGEDGADRGTVLVVAGKRMK